MTINTRYYKGKKTNVLTHLMPLVSFYTSLKTSENPWFADVFRRYITRPNGSNLKIYSVIFL